ncbi:MAG: hypothetical protein FD126_1039 [Elusimicrobia bacterium]|nr:MAG: hypothetical protein FD126_1039 [Elusimicrobiota bacterium]
MTPRRVSSVKVPRARALGFSRVGEGFWEGAEVAREFGYPNAAGVLLVHAAIAYADAVSIHVNGVKSRGDDHLAAVGILKGLPGGDEALGSALRHLEKVIEVKNRVSYEGEEFRSADLETLRKHSARFREWARKRLKD